MIDEEESSFSFESVLIVVVHFYWEFLIFVLHVDCCWQFGECYRRSPNFKTAKIKVIAVVAMHARTRDRQIEYPLYGTIKMVHNILAVLARIQHPALGHKFIMEVYNYNRDQF